VALACACSKKPTAIAELTKSEGPVERQAGGGAWGVAVLGTQYFIGDAARTADGAATLLVGGRGGAQILMQGHTVLRFAGVPGASKISVEAGAIDLAGTGSYALDVGAVTLSKDGAVRVTSLGDGRSSVELTIGAGSVASNGQTFNLAIGKSIAVSTDARPPLDAGVPDARLAPRDAAPPVDAAEDAGDPGAAGAAAIEVTGRQARWLAPGQTAWKPLAPGPGKLPKGSSVKLGQGTTARATAGSTAVELTSGSQLTVSDELGFTVDAGTVRATAAAPASIALQGGAVELDGSAATPVEARLEVTARETRVAMVRGGAKLTGGGGAHVALNRGESAALQRNGAIRVVEAIPSYFDLRVVAGESLTIHDPKPPTAVRFQFDGKCPEGGIIELDRDTRFLTSKVTSGKEFANAMLSGGGWAYRLRCTTGGGEGAAIASGRISTIRDDGRRPLPKNQGVNDIDADGRNYRISYQSAIPSIAIHVQNPGATHKLHLASGGKEATFESSTASITVPGSQLHEGTYNYWIDRDGVKQDKVSTLTIDFDQTAPQVYIESPINGQPWSGDIDVRGAVLPGWSAAVESLSVPIDPQRRFAAKVGIPASNALAIRLSHPQRGVHYYLRRPK